MEQSVTGIVSLFIVAAIMISIGITILGSTDFTDCKTMQGFNTNSTDSAGWSKLCYNSQSTIQDSYGILIVILIIIAAVGIMGVLRFL